jgi:predicted RNA-binding Zn ribbon-like protein
MSRIPLPSAPGADEHTSLALVNSAVNLPGGHVADGLGSPAEATAWLVGHRLVPGETTLLAYCQGRLTTLRGDLRALFTSHVEGAVPAPETLASVNRALVKVPSAMLLQYDATSGLGRVPRHPVTQLVDHAMARIAEDAAALLTGEQAGLLAQCEATSCDRFLLRTHARRYWCSTRCGDRVRAARAYARKLERAQAG